MLALLHKAVLSPLLLFITSVVVLSGPANGQATFQGCCDVKMMDASQQVVIDLGRPLAAGTYRGLSVRFCSTDRIYIQIWNLVNSTTAQLKWQVAYTPTAPRNNQLYSTINLAVNPITIGDNDRLGLYGYSSVANSTKMAVPYRLDALLGNMYLTQSRYNDPSVFTTGLLATLSSSTQLKRTFDQFVRLCSNADCSDQPIITQPQASVSQSLPFCGCPAKCSPDAVITNTLSLQNSSTQYLSTQIASLVQQLNSLTSSTVDTSICPNGTVSGTYGLGYCYAPVPRPMAVNEAAVYCATTWPTGKLVDIYSSVEQMFLYNLLSNFTASKPGVYSFWTSGIFSYELKYYVWAQTEIGLPNNIMIESGYLAFDQNNAAPPTDPQHSCIVLTINTIAQTIVWQTKDCFAPMFSICKIPKTCK